MKWKKESTEFLSEKTFLIIRDDYEPLQVSDGTKSRNSKQPSDSENESLHSRRLKQQAIKTDTWPPKMKRGQMKLYENTERPKTANLERPSVLDPDLVDKLDMSLLSKELLCDSMTRYRLCKSISGGNTSSSLCSSSSSCSTSSSRRRHSLVSDFHRQQQLPPATFQFATTGPNAFSSELPSRNNKRRSFQQVLDDRFCYPEMASTSPRAQRQTRVSSHKSDTAKRQAPKAKKLDNNNNRSGLNASARISSLSSLRKKNSRENIPGDLEVFTSLTARNVPEPCRTCGRSDQPERFHSHPKDKLKGKNSTAVLSKAANPVPKIVQKPVPLNFRSDKSRIKLEETSTSRNVKVERGNSPENRPSRPASAPMRRGPKTVTCYICGREFGTASFPIHEPRCMKKWERENNSLPSSQRRAPPQRPEVQIGHSDWNTSAWVESQIQLIPCSRCGRTFVPERLSVHQKSCKVIPKSPEKRNTEKLNINEKEKPSRTHVQGKPPMVSCRMCGRSFGSSSIKIHEPQCLKRWNNENKEQSSPLQKKESICKEKCSPRIDETQDNVTINPIGEVQQKRMITCYICGRDFGSRSIAIHEPQCLKKWHLENDKLPPGQRRKEPQKPELIYKYDSASGNTVVDVAAMAEASWKSHLSQLIPCKSCGRTFYPDRVMIHEKSCKGNR